MLNAHRMFCASADDYCLFRTLAIPFQNYRHASLAYKALSPDPLLKPDQFYMEMSVISQDSALVDDKHEEDIGATKLVVEFAGASDRVLRVGVNGFFESLGVIVECFNAFDGGVLESVVDGKPVVFE